MSATPCGRTEDELDDLHRLENEALSNQKPAASRTDNKPKGSWGRAAAATSGYKGEDGVAAPGSHVAASSLSDSTCSKCKEHPAQYLLKESDPVCSPCLQEHIETQCLKTLKTNRLVTTGDRVLVALSGGCCSRAALGLLDQYRSVNHERPERNKIFFELAALHIEDFNALSSAPASADIPSLIPDSVNPSAATSPNPRAIPTWSLPLEASLLTDAQLSRALECPTSTSIASASAELTDARTKLRDLLANVKDATGKGDLTRYLREALLLRAASVLGFNRVARGDSATLCAVRVIAETCKGRGYALPGEVQFLDARTRNADTCFILPVREQLADDLQLYCTARGLQFLPRAAVVTANKSDINDLCTTFVLSLQRNHPAMVSTILKTASKLQAFDFNDPTAAPASANADAVPEALRSRKAGLSNPLIPNSKGNFVLRDYSGFCSICRAPIARDDASTGRADSCCGSCKVSLGEQAGAISDVFAAFSIFAGGSGSEYESNGGGGPLRKVTEDEMKAQLSGLLLDDEAPE